MAFKYRDCAPSIAQTHRQGCNWNNIDLDTSQATIRSFAFLSALGYFWALVIEFLSSRCLVVSRLDPQNNQICSQKSSHVMKFGFFSMARKQSVNWCTERRPGRQKRKKPRISKTMLIFFFSISLMLSWLIGCLRVKPLIKNTTKKS